jgi:predicted Zn-dependent protease
LEANDKTDLFWSLIYFKANLFPNTFPGQQLINPKPTVPLAMNVSFKTASAHAPSPNASFDELVRYAEDRFLQMDLEEAEQYYRLALKKQPKNTEIMDIIGEILVEKNNIEAAKQMFLQSIKLQPSKGATKYLNMGQLESGLRAIEYYRQGIKLLLQEKSLIEEGKIQGNVKEINKNIASALCSMAEIYLTDACFEENAENECEGLLKEALKIDPNNYETLQVYASFKISQQKPDEALIVLEQSYQQWKHIAEKLQNVDDEHINSEIAIADSDSNPDELLPSIEFRIETAKLFLELGKNETAADILEYITTEQDFIPEIWWLLGLAYSKFDVEGALEALTTCQQLLEKPENKDPEMLSSVTALIQQLKSTRSDLITNNATNDNNKTSIDIHNDDNLIHCDNDDDEDEPMNDNQ